MQYDSNVLTQSRLKELLDYNPETGEFTTRLTRGGSLAGTTVGTVAKRGAVVIRLDYRLYYAHRLAWLWMTGAWPPKGIDHRDVDPTNNRWTNLRLADQSMNGANRRKQRNGIASRFKGVTFDASRNKWVAQTALKQRRVFIGRFDTEEAAHAAYVAKAKELFGEFARAA